MKMILLKFAKLLPENRDFTETANLSDETLKILKSSTILFLESGGVLTGEEMLGLTLIEKAVLRQAREEIELKTLCQREALSRLTDEELEIILSATLPKKDETIKNYISEAAQAWIAGNS
jgi:hypothetical protein